MKNSEISFAARKVVEAVSAEQSARHVLSAAQKKLDSTKGRIDALAGERLSVIARRQNGKVEDGDGPRIALLVADIEGLTGILAEQEAELGPVRMRHQEATRRLAGAREELARVEAIASAERLRAHADVIAGQLAETMRRLDELHAKIGYGRPIWAPEPRFLDALRALDLRAGVR